VGVVATTHYDLLTSQTRLCGQHLEIFFSVPCGT
jgi:hypothetical protein